MMYPRFTSHREATKMYISLTATLLQSRRHKLLRMKQTPILHLLFAATLSVAAVAQVRSSTDVPPGQHAILTVTGKGVQIYECQLVANVPQWVFQAPDASLYDASGAKVGVHGAGPSWRYLDRSSVKGEVVTKTPSPEPPSVPWLLLKAIDEDGSGLMTRVEFIRRSDTHGGNPPTTGCDSQHLTTTTRIPYTATYTFYSAKP
jgi:hypothetical protein